MTDLPSILDLLDLKQLDDNRYQSQALFEADWDMFGGQVAAQALYAAGLTVADGRPPHSLHAYFVRRGDTSRPTVFQVERDRDGFSFSARRVVASQDGEVIFTLAASFTKPGGRGGSMPDQDAEPAPVLPAPDTLRPWAHPKYPSFEFRVPDEELERRLPVRFWIRCTTVLPDDPLVHAAVIAFTSDISSALVPFENERTVTGPSLDHAVWFHRPARMDGWTWQELTPHVVAGGRGWYTVTVRTADGTLVSSVTQEQLLARRR
ncbi:acyl-CoA thioesterase [Trebonia kvetii]|nr:acyl-CoA thioesterase domain-containing protein [Trebonia kvetii]